MHAWLSLGGVAQFPFSPTRIMMTMALRILLSLAMLIPAAPVKPEAGECPFKTIDECRAWLEKCCGAAERVREFCPDLDCNSGDTCREDRTAAGHATCCSANDESAEPAASDGEGTCCSVMPRETPEETNESCCGSTSCGGEKAGTETKSNSAWRDASPNYEPSRTRPSCSTHSRAGQGLMQCLWCCCCPLRPIRLPEPQPTPVTQRSTLEKVKALEDAIPIAFQSIIQPPRRDIRESVEIPRASSTRQAILCIWLN